MIDIDNYLIFKDPEEPYLNYARTVEGGAMWAPILEKAWSKIKGSYENADWGYTING